MYKIFRFERIVGNLFMFFGKSFEAFFCGFSKTQKKFFLELLIGDF